MDDEAEKVIKAETRKLKKEAKESRRRSKRMNSLLNRRESLTTTFHPLFADQLTPRGKKMLDKRRAKNKVAKAARKRNR